MENQAKTRKKVGLALGGGGARGFAHIGVIKALKDLGIPIDYIAGTSMGAIVGGLYALTESVENIEDRLEGLEGKNLKVVNAIIRKDAKPIMKNQSMLQLIDEFFGNARFEDCHVPFRAVATDVKTGIEISLDKGLLAPAVKASAAIPVVFQPVEIDGRLLVDGGLARPIPADVVKAMGADVVIAVDVSAKWVDISEDLTKAIRWQSFYSALSDILAAVSQQISREVLKNNADIVLHPSVMGYNWLEFGDSADVIAAGYREAYANKDLICGKTGCKPKQKTGLQVFLDFLFDLE
ncbi:MAG: patatin-like phospholipase family protein [Patescibacteria group bacterium]|nr:patatin-like phospholipase family protein [Patescibacteria group bacterium]MCL5262127.1 patatin-like phospholipase family protein [Patescibacteria group bacterium]